MIAALLGAILITSIVLAVRSTGPFYRGKSVQYWFGKALAEQGDDAGRTAILDLGAKAAPYLASVAKGRNSKLYHLLQDSDPLTQTAAAVALCYHDPYGAEPLRIVIDTLQRKDHALLRSMTAHFTGQIGPRAQPCVPALRELCQDAELSVRVSATHALKKIAPETLLTGLQK